MSHKHLLAGGIGVFFTASVGSVLALTISYHTPQAFQVINPFAALTAITVALIGLVWFKKTNR